MLVPIVIVQEKHRGKGNHSGRVFGGVLWCLRKHANLYTSVFSMTCLDTRPTLCSAVLAVLLLCPSRPRGWYLWGGVMSPCDLEGSSPLFLSKSPINRDTKYYLEHLVTSDWQVFPPPCCCPRFLDGAWVIGCLWGGLHVLRCHRPDLDAAPSICLPVPLGDAYQKGLGTGDHFHICIK